MSNSLDALHSSVARLRSVVEGLDDSQLTTPAYPAEWSIAQVLSHLGSGAVIMKQSVHDVVAQQAPRLQHVGVGCVEREISQGTGRRRTRCR
jgi:hypothetical protein